MKTFSDNLKDLRVAKGLSLYELARKAGIAPRTIEKIESGEVETIKRPTIEKLAAAFDMSMDDFWKKTGLLLDERTMRGRIS